MERKTPLYDTHGRYGGKIVEFGGYLLPVQYGTGVIAEHMAVRTACGLFDVSHMGEITCRGKDALRNLNHLLTNDYTNLADGRARYSPMCNEQGGVVDDLITYKVRDDTYFIVVNAANREKDFAWMKEHALGDVVFTDLSDQVAQIALQGPKAQEILEKLVSGEQIPRKYYSAVFQGRIGEMECVLSRTGYTGEDGFEIYLAAENAEKMWDLLMETGRDQGLICCGLGARDTLRLEAGMPLYGHEMNEQITPLEAGLGAFVKMGKEEFLGKKALAQRGEPTRKRVGLRATGRGILREGLDVVAGDRKVGITTSGTFAPYLKQSVAMALLDAATTKPGTAVEVDVRGRKVAAEVVPLPFYHKEKKT